MTEHYSMMIAWSNEDQTYIVSFPEWEQAGYAAHIHGDTYEQAGAKGRDLLAFLVESAQEEGRALPRPRTYAGV